MKTKLNAIIKTLLWGMAVVLIMLTALVLDRCEFQPEPVAKYSPIHTYLRELELKYWNTKYEVVEEAEKYMDRIAPTHNLSGLELLNACDKWGVDIRLPLAQGQVESHFGTKGLARKTNQVWNVGAFDGLKAEEIPQRHKYDHPNESIEDYLALLTKDYLTGKDELALMAKFVNKANKRYASNPRYEVEVKAMWDEINATTRMDSLLNQYQFLKTELGR